MFRIGFWGIIVYYTCNKESLKLVMRIIQANTTDDI